MLQLAFQPIVLIIARTARDAEAVIGSCANAARAATTQPLVASGQGPLTPFDAFDVKPDDNAQSFVRILSDDGGYGRQVRLGLIAAAADGFTHAVTLDRVRRHPVEDLPQLLDAAACEPEAIISAAPAIPRGWLAWLFRAARAHCDFWVWTQCGRFVTDSGQGYRVYPLAAVRDIGTSSASRELDVELLVKSAWLKVPIKVLPTPHASAPLASIFTPVQIARYSWRMTVLVLQRMMFADSFLEVLHRRDASETTGSRLRQAWRQTLHHHAGRPIAFALAIGVGTFFGVLPIWGVQMFTAAGAAHVLGLSKRVTLGACTISSPISLPILAYGGVLIARALHGAAATAPGGSQPLMQYAVGVIAIAGAAGLVVTLIALAAVTFARRWRERAAA